MPCTVNIPSPLRSYTHDAASVVAAGHSVDELLADMDRCYPGIRFRMIDEQGRIRQHIRIFVNAEPALALDAAVKPCDTVQLICALSGG